MENGHSFQGLINDLRLENVTLQIHGKDPILQSVDFNLPIDETIVVESSNPQNAVYLLKALAGRLEMQSGRIFFGKDSETEIFEEDRYETTGCYFESDLCLKNMNFEKIWGLSKGSEPYQELLIHFDLNFAEKQKFEELPFGLQKLIYLIKPLVRSPELLVLEDPSSGLDEKQWLDFLDFLQMKQRRGFARHVFMTNFSASALRHLSYNKLFLEEGLLYFDETAGYKKANQL